MPLTLLEQPPAFLNQYATIPIAFQVRECLQPDPATAPLATRLLQIDPPYTKDYDALPNNHPTDWPRRFDLTKWFLAAAFLDGHHVASAALVLDTTEVDPTDSHPDEAILWDIRVSPNHRRQRIGRHLLTFAESHARGAGKRRIKVETQNINVPATHFYAAAGYTLYSIDPSAYPTLPSELRMIWTKNLHPSAFT